MRRKFIWVDLVSPSERYTYQLPCVLFDTADNALLLDEFIKNMSIQWPSSELHQQLGGRHILRDANVKITLTYDNSWMFWTYVQV